MEEKQEFPSRADFRKWLHSNAENRDGIWIVFREGRESKTLTAAEALSETGWLAIRETSIHFGRGGMKWQTRKSGAPRRT